MRFVAFAAAFRRLFSSPSRHIRFRHFASLRWLLIRHYATIATPMLSFHASPFTLILSLRLPFSHFAIIASHYFRQPLAMPLF